MKKKSPKIKNKKQSAGGNFSLRFSLSSPFRQVWRRPLHSSIQKKLSNLAVFAVFILGGLYFLTHIILGILKHIK